MKNKKGITLISLVITIVVLVILSAVAIYLGLSNNGILNKADQAKSETIKQTATEKMNLKITNMQIEKYAEEQRMPTLQEFADGLCEDDEIQYVQLQSKKVGSLNKIEVGEAESIFTKLKEYPYEFEINSSLQLASINGIKVASSISKEEFISKTQGTAIAEDINKGKTAYVNGECITGTGNVIKAYVTGVIATYSTDSVQCGGYGYSSNSEYFTVSGGIGINYFTVNVLKNMHIKVVITTTGRGSSCNRTIYINNVAKDVFTAEMNSYKSFEYDCSDGDTIKIVSDKQSNNIKAASIFIYAM